MSAVAHRTVHREPRAAYTSAREVRDRLAMAAAPAIPVAPREPAIDVEQEPDALATVSAAHSLSWMHVLPALAIVAALWWGRVVLIPVVLSVLLSYALEPVVRRLQRWRVPRAASAVIVMTGLVGLLGLATYGLSAEAVSFIDRMPSAVHTVSRAIEQAATRRTGVMTKMRDAARELETATTSVTRSEPRDGVESVRLSEPTFRWSDWLWQGSRNVGALAGQMFAVICLTYYLLIAGDLYKRKLVRIVPTFTDKKIAVEILDEIDRQIQRFLFARAALSLIIGAIVWIAFRAIGLNDAGVWGVLSAVSFTVPVIGPTVIVAAAAIVAFVQFGSIGMAALAGGLAVAVGVVESNILTPWLMRRVGEMNAAAVFVSLIFWGWIWGIWGLLLAVPITAAAKAVCERVPDLAPFAELLKE